MKTNRLLKIGVLLAIFSFPLLFAGNLLAAESSSTVSDKIVATVNDEPVRVSELAAHIAATNLPRDEAFSDLIDLKLLRNIAATKGVRVPAGNWSADERNKVESDLVKAIPLPVPAYVGELVVDHAYLKLAGDEKGQKAGLALMKRLRAMVTEGATIPEAFNKLQVDGSDWHIGDHEEYPASALPDETRELPAGGLSNVLISSDGYNLFRIHERKIPVEEIRQAVRIYLLEISSGMVNIIEE